jgi:hypothetical protein
MSNRLIVTLVVTAFLVASLAWVVKADGGSAIRDWFVQVHGHAGQ